MTLGRPRLRQTIAAALAFGLIAPVFVSDMASGRSAAPPSGAYRTLSLRGDLGGSPGGARAALADVLSRRAEQTGVTLSDISLETVRRSPLGVHVRGAQLRDGVAVAGTWVIGWFSRGRMRRVDLRVSHLPGRPSADPLPESRALRIARALVAPAQVAPARAERLLVPFRGRLMDVWRVTLPTRGIVAEIDLSATSGRVLSIRDPARYEDTSATVFDPNPVVSLRDSSLRQPGVDVAGVDTDLDDPRLTAALVTLPVREADAGAYGSGRLVGPYADVQGPAPLTKSGEGGFAFTRGDPRFETVMAYVHIDRLQRYFQTTLGLGTVNAEPQNVYAIPVQGFDNSLYIGGSDIIVLGSGGVDDGEDAEVIVHEYGHAVHDDQVPGWGQSNQSRAMGEGFGDFLAAAFFARTSSGGFQDACIADWDATSYSDESPACLRRMDVQKRYPDDMEGEEHADGEIWSAFLWKLRSRLGTRAAERSDNALHLVLVSHELLSPSATFKQGVAALRTTAQTLGHPEWVAAIDESARAYGL